MTMYEEPPIVALDEILDEGGADAPTRTVGQWVILAVVTGLAVVGVTLVLLFAIPALAGFLTDVLRFLGEQAAANRDVSS